MTGRTKNVRRIASEPYHMAWLTRDEKSFLFSDASWRVIDTARDVCRRMGATMLKGRVFGKRVHFIVAVPQYIDVGFLLKRLKDDLAIRILDDFPEILDATGSQGVWEEMDFCSIDNNGAMEDVRKFLKYEDDISSAVANQNV